MTHLTFIRHGETDWNRQLRFQGQIDVPLNATGHAQAARLAERLASTPADLLFSSDLQRARDTAAPLARAWGAELRLLPALREQHFGVLEGLGLAQVQERYRDLWAQWQRHDADFALPGGGESQRQFSGRVLAAVNALTAAHRGRHVAIVTHGGVLDMIWRNAKGLPLDGRRDCEIPNTGVNRLRWHGDALEIIGWADASHLADDPPAPT